MKKIIGLLLAFVMVLSTSMNALAISGENYITRASAVEKIVNTLYQTDETKDFSWGNYCLHASGYVHFVPVDSTKKYPVLCQIYNSVEGSGFSDLKEVNDSTVFITLAKSMGIINGNKDNTFAPNVFTTYNQAVKMMVCMIGYGDKMAKEKGGYPNGYLEVAKDFGITKGMTFNGNDKISSEDFDLMLKNCLAMNGSLINVFRIDFAEATTPEDCVNTYAQAVKDRCGTIQYALMDNDLREQTRKDFISFYWVTGESNLWVEGYDIDKVSDLLYNITFHYTTSAGSERDVTVEIKLKQYSDFHNYYVISELNR